MPDSSVADPAVPDPPTSDHPAPDHPAPDAPTGPGSLPQAVLLGLLGVIAVAAGPFDRAKWVYGLPRALLVLAAAALAVGATIVLARRHRSAGTPGTALLVVLVVATAALAPLVGAQTTAWFGGELLIVAWALTGRVPGPIRIRRLEPTDPHSVGALAVLSLVAAWRGRSEWGWINPVELWAASVVAVLVVTHLGDRVAALGRWIGRGVLIGASAVVGVVVVVLPGAVGRLFGADPLRRRGTPRSGWVPVSTGAVRPERLFAEPAPSLAARGGAARARRWVAVGLALAAVAVSVVVIVDRRQSGRIGYDLSDPRGVRIDNGEIPAAYADATWYPGYLRNTEYAAKWLGAYRSVGPNRLLDGTNGYQTVRDGVRVSWRPPTCRCRRVVVWMYGASTLFGVGQRDAHTIPSELARAAWRDGIALDVVNRGVPGDQHWEEADRLLWDLAQLGSDSVAGRARPPDLVVFYDGVSDINAAAWLASHGLGDIDEPVQPATEEFLADPAIREIVDGSLRDGQTERPPMPAGLEMATTTTVPPMSPADVGRLATTRLGAALQMSRDVLSARGLPGAWFWQPSRFSRPQIEGEPTTPDDARSRATYRAATASIPDGMVDLSDVLDGSSAPLFSDDVHHNEAASRLVGGAMYRSLEARLRALASDGGSR